LIEYICRENEKDYQNIGKASDERQRVETEFLGQYAGIYTVGSPGDRNYLQLTVALSGGELWIDRTPWIRGKDAQRLIPISETTFAGNFGRRMSFKKDDHGTVTSLVFEAPEPPLRDVTAFRQKQN